MASFLGIVLGVFFSIQLNATNLEVTEISQDGHEIPCYSAGGGFMTGHRYVECSSCTSKPGRPDGGGGTCISKGH